ncbi:MAG: UDP-3-O-(3-hydroxymyristoyl)glucosamine N-acyltransferase [FCB group bacterium]|nr:UDP-3-O-(3-hydroxymyristoyl)glucosamine N-acyltransferase [FCB group bacterium]
MYTLQELASLVGGTVVGNPELEIAGVSEIQHGQPGTLTFLSNPKYKKYLADTKATAVLVADGDLLGTKAGIVVKNPQLAMTKILARFQSPLRTPKGIHPTAVVDETATIGSEVSIGAYSVVEAGARIGNNTVLGSHVTLGQESVIGEWAMIHSHAVIYHHCFIGDRAVIHSGTVIGSDGFGFVTEGDTHHKIPQNGAVIIGDDVEIGANCAIDRGTIGNTAIGDGTKFDNLVHIAHNVKIGRGCLLTAAVAIAGSTEIGDFCIFAGQAGVAPHLKIGDRAVFAAKTGVTKSLPGGKIYAGMPAREIREQNRRDAVFSQVVRLEKRLEKLEHKLFS